MPTRTRTRRLAALTGVTALALTGVASSSADAAEKTFTYDCKALGSVDVGKWTVALSMELPETVKAGSTMKAPKVSAKVTTSTGAADLLRNVLQADKVAGTGTAAYTIDKTAFKASLTVPETQVPASGAITVDSTGAGQDAEAPNAPTTSTVTAGDFNAALSVTKKDGNKQDVAVACTLPAGVDATIGTIKVVAGDPTPTETETETEDPTSTTTSGTSTGSSSSSSASSSEGSTSAPADPTSSSDAPMGPKVDTGVVGDGANGETIALGLLAIGGIAAAGLASRRRLNR